MSHTSNADTPVRCPNGCDLTGSAIPEEQRHMYGGATHYSDVIGIVENDRTVAWRCPDCGEEWPRG